VGVGKPKEKYAQRTVFVGQYDALEKLTALPVENRDVASIEQRLAKLLDGEEVLAYGSDMKRFARLIRASLNQLCS
jgi:hypothetical protein